MPFGQATLQSLYPAHAAYVSQYTAAAQADLAAGFLTRYDYGQAVKAAQAAPIPDGAAGCPPGSDDDAPDREQGCGQPVVSLRDVLASRHGQPGELAPGQVRRHAERAAGLWAAPSSSTQSSAARVSATAAAAEVELDSRARCRGRPVLVRERPGKRGQHRRQEAGMVTRPVNRVPDVPLVDPPLGHLPGQMQPQGYRGIAGPAHAPAHQGPRWRRTARPARRTSATGWSRRVGSARAPPRPIAGSWHRVPRRTCGIRHCDRAAQKNPRPAPWRAGGGRRRAGAARRPSPSSARPRWAPPTRDPQRREQSRGGRRTSRRSADGHPGPGPRWLGIP